MKLRAFCLLVLLSMLLGACGEKPVPTKTVIVTRLATPTGTAEMGPTERTIDIGTHALHAVVSGTGVPVVVFDSGIGALSSEYARLQERLSSVTTAVAYDRAGYGSSEPGPLPRDSSTEAAELRALLKKLGLAGPYILVGHSLGGLNVEVFAARYPDDVAGMVLLDPPPLSFILGEEYSELGSMASQMTDEWQGIADRGMESEDDQERAEAEFFLMVASEHREMFGASAQQAASAASFGETPLVVVASGVPNPMFGDVAEAYQEFWAEQSEALAAKSSRGEFVFAETSTHRLHEDAADLVADTILGMVESVRREKR
jgi:pimeloyl-ACP methyl ester carboxylesterase